MLTVLRYIGTGLGVVLLQWLVFGRLQLWGAYPDIVLLWVTLLALRRGRVAGAVGGFGAGFLMDVIYGTWGLHMLLKTLLGFVVGLFRSEQGEGLRLDPPAAALGALVVALVHNGLLVILLALDEGTRTMFLITGLWIGSAVYTALVAAVASLFRAR